MADYNLGRATGEVNIGYDGRGLRAAQADMAATAAEAAVLDSSMGRVNKTFDENREKNVASAESIIRHRGQVDDLRRTYQRYHDEYQRASIRSAEAAGALSRAQEEGSANTSTMARLTREATRAHEEQERLLRRSEDAYSRYHTKLSAVREEVERFNLAHIHATGGMRNMRREAEELGNTLERMSSILGTVARTIGTGGIMGLFGLASGAQLATTGAAGLNGIVSLLGGALEIIKDLSGAILLLPGIISAGVVSLGVLATAFHGVGEAIGAMEDPAKFLEAIKDMGPLTQQAMLSLQSFTEAFRGARQVVQESFFAQIVQDIQPLVQTWLPLLMNAGREVAGQFGSMFHEAFSVFQDPAIQKGFQGFIQNMSIGMQAARGAIRPFIEAWTTLSVVGSEAFQRLGVALTNVVNRFNAWIQRSAESGKLTEWIDRALDAFTKLGNILINIGSALGNIFSAARGDSGGVLDNILRLTQEFKEWTESVKGQNTLVNFFELLREASDTARPVLKLLGESIAIVAGTLTRLGIAIGPGITSFFTSFRDALAELRPHILAIAPALNDFLTVMGDTLVQVVRELGPELPKLFRGLADAFIALAPILPGIAEGIAKILDHLSPGDIEGIFIAIIALKGLSTAFAGLIAIMSINPIMLAIGAIAALGLGLIYAYNHSKQFRDTVNNLWSGLRRFGEWIKNTFVSAIRSIGDAFKGIDLSSWFSDVWASISDWFNNTDWPKLGRNLVQGIIDGMADMLGPVGRMATRILEKIKDPIPESRAKVGPFSQASPEELGAKLASDYASGIESGSTGVGAASLSLASSAAGGGTGGPSIGAPGGSGARSFEQGKSGFDQAVTFLTKDLSAWSSIIQNAFNLFKDIGQIFIDTVRVTANLWNRGDNPLTRPGGVMGPPQAAPQQAVPGVPSLPIKGVAPDEYGRQLAAQGGGPGWNQQDVPGVPRKPLPPPGGTTGGGPPVFGPPLPATTTGQAPPGTQGLPNVEGTAGTGTFSIQPKAGTTGAPPPPAGNLGANPPKQDIANYIYSTAISKGYTPEQADAFVVQATGESSLEPGIVSPPSAGNETGAAVGIFQFVPGTATGIGLQDPKNAQQNIDAYFRLADRAGGPAAFAAQGPAQFLGVNVSGGGPWHPANQRRGDLTTAQRNAAPFIANIGPTPTAPPAAGGPGGGIGLPQAPAPYPLGPGRDVNVASLQGAGFPPLFENPPGGGSPNIPPWVQDFVKQYGGPSLVAASTPHGALHGRPGTAGYAVDVTGDPAEMDRLAKFLEEHPEASAMMIHQDVSGEPRGVLAGQAVPKGTVFTTPGGTYADEATMVHWAPSGGSTAPPPLAPPPPATTTGAVETPGLPRGEGAVTPGGFHLPSDGATLAIGGASALAGGVAAFIGARAAFRTAFRIADIPANMRTRWLRSHFNELDAKAKLDVIRSLTPNELAEAGITSPDQITFGEGARPSITGINADISGAPELRPVVTRAPSAFAQLGLAEQRELGAAIQSVMQQPGGIRGEGPIIPDPTGVPPARPPATTTGEAPASVAGDAGRGIGSRAAGVARGLGRILALSGPGISSDVQTVDAQGRPIDAQGRPLGTPGHQLSEELRGYGRALASGATITGQESDITPGVIYGPNGEVISAGPRAPSAPAPAPAPAPTPAPRPAPTTPALGSAWRQYQAGQQPTYNQPVAAAPPIQGPFAPGSLGGPPGSQAERRGSTPVHVTNPQQMPGGTQAPPIVQREVRPAAVDRPPRPGEPGFVGPVAPAQPRTVTGDQGPQPGAQAERRGPPPPPPPTLGSAATRGEGEVSGQIGADTGQAKSKKSPIEQFQDTLSSVGSIAGDAFQIFNDIIRNIGAAANITDLLVRGFANTEDVMFYIDEMQTFITTAADVAKLVGDIGGMVSGSSGGADFGAGGAIQAIAGIISSALEATNAAIDLGQEVYREVTKYAGFIIGSFLGGPGTGPLGGNVRMLLNTSTNQLYTYSEDNPLNKNTFEVPVWQRSYTQTPPPTTISQQTNIYAGPGQTPRDMMNETMWLVGTGSPAVASVSGQD
jgi:hypothetical protein